MDARCSMDLMLSAVAMALASNVAARESLSLSIYMEAKASSGSSECHLSSDASIIRYASEYSRRALSYWWRFSYMLPKYV